jgi:FkbM family methyltransferase
MCKPDQTWINDLKFDTMIDIGANIGDYSKEFRAYRPEAMIYAFEPLPAEYGQLSKFFEFDKKFKAFNVALSDVEGETTFNVCNFGPASSILKINSLTKDYIKKGFSIDVASNQITVRTVRLDEFVNIDSLGKCLFIKSDTQGFEDKVIRGGQNTFRRANLCVIETMFQPQYEGQALFADILYQMMTLGFTYFGDKDYVSYHNINNTPVWQDSVFINNRLLKNGIY